jgi:hypothetical protein
MERRLVSQHRVRVSWIEQFLLRRDVDNPFAQAVLAAQQLATVAEDRVGLTRAQFDDLRSARYQAELLEDLVRSLDDDVAGHGRRADEALVDETGAAERARTLQAALTCGIRASATLVEACQALLEIAERLLVVERPHSRLLLMAAVETLRTAAATAHLTVAMHLPRITDVTLYDELARGLGGVEAVLASADRVAATLRAAAVWRALPEQRRRHAPVAQDTGRLS